MAVSTISNRGLSEPAATAAAVTPNDSTDLTVNARGLYVGGAGNLVVLMAGESSDAATVTFVGVAAGTVLPIRVRRVTTSTTATSIVALY